MRFNSKAQRTVIGQPVKRAAVVNHRHAKRTLSNNRAGLHRRTAAALLLPVTLPNERMDDLVIRAALTYAQSQRLHGIATHYR